MPLSVRDPATTHEFEPMPSPTSPTSTLAASMTPDVSCHSTVVDACWSSPSPTGVAGAKAASAPVSRAGTVVILGTMTGFSSNGYAGYSCSRVDGTVPSSRVAARRARSVSSSTLPRRSQAIALSQATESAGSHGSGAYSGFCMPMTAYSRESSAPERESR